MGKVRLRWYRLWAVAALLLISACSGTSFVYNRLDFLLPWYVDDYAELNPAQKAYLDDLLAPFLLWHRTQELPRYVKVLEGIEDNLQGPLTSAEIAATFAQLEQAWLRLESKALDWLLNLGTRLTDEQMVGFLKVMWERQHEYEDDYLKRTEAEFYQDSYDDLLDSAEDYLGGLSEKQRGLLHDASHRLLRSDKVWLQERAEWLKQLAVLLERQPGWQQRIRDAVVARRANTSPEYLRIYDHNMNVIYDTIALLLNDRSAQQDRHLRHTLSDLRKELQTLAQSKDAGKSPAG